MKVYEKFKETEEPPKQIIELLRTLKVAFSAITYAAVEYYFKGPLVSDWTLSYHVTVKTIRAILSMSRTGPLPDVVGAQRRSSRPSRIRKTTKIIPQEFKPDKQVLDFLKERAPGEWPEHITNDCTVYGEYIVAKGAKREHVILYLHGGGYVVGSVYQSRFMTQNLSEFGKCSVYAINYRLAPQNPYPCGLVDAVSAYLHLLNSFKPQHIVLTGDSAGGGLALATLLVLRDLKIPMPAGCYCMSPWVDLTHSNSTFLEHAPYDFLPDHVNDPRLGDRLHYYTENEFLKLPYVSPLFAKGVSEFPPILIQTGSVERLFGENKQMAEKSGAPIRFEVYQSHVHVFQIFPLSRGSKVALTRFGQWIQEVWECRIQQSQTYYFHFNGTSLVDQ